MEKRLVEHYIEQHVKSKPYDVPRRGIEQRAKYFYVELLNFYAEDMRLTAPNYVHEVPIEISWSGLDA